VLSYRHGFHAGNPADVFKHTVLVALVRAMQHKPVGITLIDTHAGPALYDLDSAMALKNREFDTGIARARKIPSPPAALADYLALVESFNADGPLHRYPGSPMLLDTLRRPVDRLIVCERHPGEQKALQARFAGKPGVEVRAGNGYAILPGLLPPPTRRGLVLIDPSFETRSELDEIGTALSKALKRFAHGVFAVWYPVLDGRGTTPEALPERLGLGGEQWLDLRTTFPASQRLGRMAGCGMAIINCPYRARKGLLETLREDARD